MNIKLLDCTLRDGGFINNWEFGNITIRSVVSRLDSAYVDIIECGFLDSGVSYSENRSVFPDIPSIERTLGGCIPQNAELVAMIDYGTFDEDKLISKSESCLDGIRLIFQKEKAKEALEYAKKIKEKGYRLYVNLVATFTYSGLELLQLVDEINKINPIGVSIVDTYGIMFGDEMTRYAYLLDGSLNKNIMLGFHSHNNTNFSDANSVSFIGLNFKRDMIVDGSLLGMGKNSGNAHTEVLALYLNKMNIKEFKCDHILECAVTDIQRFQINQEWGYNVNNLVTAICECSPNWIKYYMRKGTLSISNIMEILNDLPKEKRKLVSFFSEQLAEERYMDFCRRYEVSDKKGYEALKKAIGDRSVLILCPGSSLLEYIDEIKEFISRNNPFIISVNFISPDFEVDCLYVGSNRRYSQMAALLNGNEKYEVITTSNIVANTSLIPKYTFSYPELFNEAEIDNSAIILMTLLARLGVAQIIIAGFDGYREGLNNYFSGSVSLGNSFADNDKIKSGLLHFMDTQTVELQWITPSVFEEIVNDKPNPPAMLGRME